METVKTTTTQCPHEGHYVRRQLVSKAWLHLVTHPVILALTSLTFGGALLAGVVLWMMDAGIHHALQSMAGALFALGGLRLLVVTAVGAVVLLPWWLASVLPRTASKAGAFVMAVAALVVTSVALIGLKSLLLVGIGIVVALVMTARTTWLAWRHVRDSRATTTVQLVGGPSDGAASIARYGSVACLHGYALSTLCDNCGCDVLSRRPILSSAWYTIVGGSAFFTPPAGVRLPNMSERSASAELASVCKILTTIADDVAAGGMVADYMRLASALLYQEQHDEKSEAVLETLQQEAIKLVIASAKITSAQTIMRVVTADERELNKDERTLLDAAVALMNETIAEKVPASMSNWPVLQEMKNLVLEMQGALDRKPKSQVHLHDESSARMLDELEILKAGRMSLDNEDNVAK